MLSNVFSGHDFKNIVNEIINRCEILPVTDQVLIYDELSRLMTGNLNDIQTQLDTWNKDLIAQYLYSEIEPSPYLQIVNILWNGLKKANPDNDKTIDWNAIIKIVIINQRSFQQFKEPSDSIIRYYPKISATAKAAKNLRKLGYSIELKNGDIFLPEAETIKLETEIDKLCKSIGGQRLFYNIFSNLQPNYDQYLERYNLVRHVVATPYNNQSSQIPWGYILQLAIKYFRENGININIQNKINKLIKLVTNAIALYEIQAYSIYESLFLKPEGLIPYLTESVQYDYIFTIPQVRKKDIKLVYDELLTPFIEKLPDNVKTEIELCFRICDYLLSDSDAYRTTILDPVLLSRNLGIETNRLINILECHLVNLNPNQDLKFPPTSIALDFFEKPLLKQNDKKYLILPTSICGLPIFNALQSILRKYLGNNFDNKLGTPIEIFLKNEFSKHGINVKSGEYNINDHEKGECDLVVETDKCIIFFEIKKKVLTRKGQLGNTNMLVDLSKSIVLSQKQALGHESEILEKKQIILTPAGSNNTYTLLHNNRKILRISVSLYDFGSLHSSPIVKKLLETCAQFDFIANDEDDAKKIEEINSVLKDFRKPVNKLNELYISKNNDLFSSSLFFSVNHLLIFLDNINSSEEFYNKLIRTKDFLTGTQDFYADHLFLEKIK